MQTTLSLSALAIFAHPCLAVQLVTRRDLTHYEWSMQSHSADVFTPHRSPQSRNRADFQLFALVTAYVSNSTEQRQESASNFVQDDGELVS